MASYPTATVAELLCYYNINQASANTIKLANISLEYLWSLIGVELGCLPPASNTAVTTQQPDDNMAKQQGTETTPIDLTSTVATQQPKMRKQRGPGRSVRQSASRPHLQAHEHHSDLQICIGKTATELADPAIIEWLCTPQNGIHPDQFFGAAALLLSMHATYPVLVDKINAKLHAEGSFNEDLTVASKTLNKRKEEALKHIFGDDKAIYAQNQAEFRKARKDDALKAQYVQKLLSAATYTINLPAVCARCKVKEKQVSESDAGDEGEATTPPAPSKRKFSDDDPATTSSSSQPMQNPAKRSKSEQAVPSSFLEMFVQQFVGPVLYEPIPSFEPGFGEAFDEIAGL